MITEKRKAEILNILRDMEESLVVINGRSCSIAQLSVLADKESKILRASNDSLAPILRTALVINWRESAMVSRYKRFKESYPSVSDLSKLQRVLDSTAAINFCKEYLNINANENKPDANPKYVLLKTLTKGFLDYQKENSFLSEIEAIRHWAENLKISALNQDFIAKNKGVGIGVVENIRLNLGYSVIKPDRHVIGVMKQCFNLDIRFEFYNEFAESIGLSPRYLDCVLFEYGKLKKISA